jgi:hypothetical protein
MLFLSLSVLVIFNLAINYIAFLESQGRYEVRGWPMDFLGPHRSFWVRYLMWQAVSIRLRNGILYKYRPILTVPTLRRRI